MGTRTTRTTRRRRRRTPDRWEKTQLSTPWPYGYPLAPNSLPGSCFFNKVFSIFFCFFNQKPQKNLEKTKNTQKHQNSRHYGPMARVFFWFSRVFFAFGQKWQKLPENKKHTKAPKLSTLRPLCGFFWFSRVFFCFWPKLEKLQENKKNKWPPLGPT